ncbi:MAG: LON peptidase substrate-binding domain-containing protein, partial [Acidobacteriota bacterium]
MASTRIQKLPMVPLREVVVFPGTLVPFVVGRQSSLKALERALAQSEKRVFLACQRDASVDEPAPEEIHSVGTVATIVQSLRVASGNMRVLVEGLERARALETHRAPDGFLVAETHPLAERHASGPDLDQLVHRLSELFETYVKNSPSLPAETVLATMKVSEPGRLADTVAAHLMVGAEVKQDLLERVVLRERVERLVQVIELELEKLRLDKRLTSRVKQQLERAQREYYLS